MINPIIIDAQIKEIQNIKTKEQEKNDFEDKDYDSLLLKINFLLKELESLQSKPLKKFRSRKSKKTNSRIKTSQKGNRRRKTKRIST